MKRLATRLLILAVGIGVLAMPGLPVSSEESAKAEAVFDRMAAAINGLHDYQAQWTHYSTTVGNKPIHGKKTARGKFLRSPALYYEYIVKNENNFNDQSGEDTQLIYDSRDKIQNILLPGGRRILGVVKLFAEDVKCLWLNGEALHSEALWDRLEDWQKMRATGSMTLRTESYRNKSFNVITLQTSKAESGQRPEITKVDIWIDPDDNLPRRYQGFVQGRAQPVLDYQITELKPNQGLGPDDIEFEGLSLWTFPAQFLAGTEGLDSIKYKPLPTAIGASAPGFDEVIKNFSNALAQIKDYRAELILTQKYFRLKCKGNITASVIRDPFFFIFETDDDFSINHIHLTSPGGKNCYYRSQDSYASVGGGAMRLVGVQLMHVDDLRADFAFGERFLTMNLFALEDRMKWYAQHHKVSVEMVKANNLVCPRVIMKRNGPPKPARIQDMAVVFDPDTWLPLRVEYLNTADKKGFATIDYKSIKTNQGLKEADLKF